MSEEYKPMNCPVCDNFYFSELQEDDNPETFQCLSCGWKYDLRQVDFPDEADDKNGMSLNEFRRQYEEKLAENPKYSYLDETIPDAVPHDCPICGKYRFADEYSYDICPECGWEDDGSEMLYPNDDSGPNGMSFNDYRKQYMQKLKENPDYRWKNSK